MDALPPELLRAVLLSTVHLSRADKNVLLPLRLVNKRFDFILREYIFKTVQLDFSRFARGETAPQMSSLANVGHLSQALYCDMMVIRDEEEIDRLFRVFNSIIGKVPEMTTLLDSLRQYCMTEKTFDETDFRRVMEGVLGVTPNLTRLKLNLPFQVIGRASRTATLLLATTFACFAKRPSESRSLETLVLDHVSDSSILDICQNPIDLGNALHTFKYLKNLVLSVKRQESSNYLISIFSDRLWLLISEATNLESLCITGWNVKSSGTRRRRARIDFNDWMMKSLPCPNLDSQRTLKHLRFLELKRIDIDPVAMQRLIEQCSSSLKELYLNDVFLKIFHSQGQGISALWIGHGSALPKPQRFYSLAENLRKIESLNLDVLRVSGLGYNDFNPSRGNEKEEYDLADPLGLNRSFEQRFVEAVLGHIPPSPKRITDMAIAIACPRYSTTWHIPPLHFASNIGETMTGAARRESSGPSMPFTEFSIPPPLSPRPCQTPVRKIDYDVEAFQRFHNTTSHWKCTIDGLFYNHNEKALVELQKIIGVADRGMALLSNEIDRLHSMSTLPEG